MATALSPVDTLLQTSHHHRSATSITTATSPGVYNLLNKTSKKRRIAYLTDENRRLAAELKSNETLLSQFMDLAHEQSRKISSLSAAFHDTVPWNSSTCPQPSDSSAPSSLGTAHAHPEDEWIKIGTKSKVKAGAKTKVLPVLCSTPNRPKSAPLLTDVVRAGTNIHVTGSKSCLELSNRYGPLSAATPSVPVPLPGDRGPASASSVKSSTSSSRRNIVKEAALRAIRSGESPRTEVIREPTATGVPRSQSPPTPTTQQRGPSPPPPRPLFTPTTAIVGDSIIRHVRFFNATTYCFPGATVSTIIDKLPGLLQSFPDSIKRIILHIGANDVVRCQSELLKVDFKNLFTILKDCGKSVFISGPLPTLGLGDYRYCRLLSLHFWLRSACSSFGFDFIDNFNLFWNRSAFYRYDGLHPGRLGSRILTANIQHTVHVFAHTC